jgi:hypothetical protein
MHADTRRSHSFVLESVLALLVCVRVFVRGVCMCVFLPACFYARVYMNVGKYKDLKAPWV